jgi:UDP-3-O-acyl N-acetylglucosamine deacetylase
MVGFGPMQIQTTEHLLAALSGLSIDNIEIEIDNVELPGLDGSAIGFAEAIRGAGIVEQPADKSVIAPAEALWCRDADSAIVLLPDEGFRVSYTLHYPGIGTQYFSVEVTEKGFMEDVAPARTFCSELEAMELLKRGLGKGANYENTLVMGSTGPINNRLRFPDEPARHKALDLIGDLYLAGPAIKARVIAVKSGHRLNMEMVRLLRSANRERDDGRRTV